LPHLSHPENRKDTQIFSGHHASTVDMLSGLPHDGVVTVLQKIP